ncbi:MAG: enoyl-CoA hydratase/isomerase family protein [Actinomycetota bacterium]|nr:enoyl-CoA hydratase/isomerase family protein [Actinomycetota bacterium]
MSKGLKIQADGALLTVLMDHGEGNQFTREMCEELSSLLAEPPAGARVLLLRSAGPTFCTGRDGSAKGASQVRAMARALAEVNVGIVFSDLTVVSEVGGATAGFGVGLAGLSDVTIASSGATFRFPEVAASLAPALVLAWLPHVVGRRMAYWLASTGCTFDAAEAMRMGIINEVVEPEALSRRVDEVVETLLAAPAPVIQAIKRDLLSNSWLQMREDSFAAADRLALRALTRADQDQARV